MDRLTDLIETMLSQHASVMILPIMHFSLNLRWRSVPSSFHQYWSLDCLSWLPAVSHHLPLWLAPTSPGPQILVEESLIGLLLRCAPGALLYLLNLTHQFTCHRPQPEAIVMHWLGQAHPKLSREFQHLLQKYSYPTPWLDFQAHDLVGIWDESFELLVSSAAVSSDEAKGFGSDLELAFLEGWRVSKKPFVSAD